MMRAASTHKSLLLRTFVVLSCLCSALVVASSLSDLQGTYRMARLVNASRDAIDLGNATYEFTLDLDRTNANGMSVYSFGVTIGNVIAGTMVLDEANGTVTNTLGWSTRMYPGPELYAIEVALLEVIGHAKTFGQRFENNTLVFFGREGGTLVLRDTAAADPSNESPAKERNSTGTKNNSTGGTRRLRH